MTRHKKRVLSSLLFIGTLAGGAGVAVAAPTRAAPLGANQESAHVTIDYNDMGHAYKATYAVPPETLRQEKLWQAQQPTRPSGQQVEAWLADHGAKLDSRQGPAVTFRFTDGAVCKEYYRDGQLDRKHGPAENWRDANGITTFESYWQGGLHDRQHGPAVTTRYADGGTSKEYWHNGQFDRQHGPADIWTFPDGVTWSEMYWHKDKLDRKDGPAIVWRASSGQITDELFYQNGVFMGDVQPTLPSARPLTGSQAFAILAP